MAAIVLGVLLFSSRSLASAFGVSPPWIANDNLKPDSHYVYVIDLSTNDPKEDMVITAKITGDKEIQNWITIKDVDHLLMPTGMQHTPIYVEVNVPKDAPLGKFSGNISLTASPVKLSPDNVSILLGGNISVQLKVIDHDIVDYWVRSIAVDPIVEGQPITLSVDLKNLGNILISNLETRIQVLDFKTEKVIASANAGQLSRPIYPQTLETTQIQVPTPNLPEGKYWLKVDAIKGGKSIYQNKLYLEVASPNVNGSVRTAVRVAGQGEAIQPAAPTLLAPTTSGQNVQLRTTVTVRAPFTNSLIMIVIGLMLVIIGISFRIYRNLSGKKPAAHHHR